MFITGRKVRQTMHDITFNDKLCKWEYQGEANDEDREQKEAQARLEFYETSDIRLAVVKIASNLAEPWRGRASNLVQEAASIGIGLRETAKEIGGLLSSMQGLFMNEDQILIEKIKNGTGAWIYKIHPQQKTDNPFC